jgi:dihydroorotate dehydrogenase (fumarate)
MADLSTSYMGLELRNPIIVASCDLTRDAAGIKKCDEAGAGAVVLKSIFEEQFLIEGGVPEEDYAIYPEALDYLRSGGLLEYAPNKICQEITKAKEEVNIPIIASVNCQTHSLWPRFARQVEDAGADGLELNIYNLPIDLDKPGFQHDELYLKILKEVKQEISIPISVKLIPQVSSLPYLSHKLADSGCDALVLFNWFLEPDIDINSMKTYSRKGKANFHQSLRWVALLAGRIDTDIAASGGIGSSEEIVKQLLAGASAIQVCSLFYRKGFSEIKSLLNGLRVWMDENKYHSLDEFQGEISFKKQELSFRDMGQASNYFRAQYLKTYSK